MTGERLFTSFQIHNLTFCSNERTMCTNCLGFTVMQFYVVLLVTEWMCLFKITSVHLCSSSSSLLKWDNVLCSLRQVARMMLLSYPQNVSVTGIKQADNFSPSWSFQMIQDLFLKCVCNWLYLWIYFFFFWSAYNNLIHDCAADGPTVQYTEEMKELQKNSQLQNSTKHKIK